MMWVSFLDYQVLVAWREHTHITRYTKQVCEDHPAMKEEKKKLPFIALLASLFSPVLL